MSLTGPCVMWVKKCKIEPCLRKVTLPLLDMCCHSDTTPKKLCSTYLSAQVPSPGYRLNTGTYKSPNLFSYRSLPKAIPEYQCMTTKTTQLEASYLSKTSSNLTQKMHFLLNKSFFSMVALYP